MLNIASFFKLLKESFRDLMPIILVILFFQLAILQTVPEGWMSTAIGLAIVGVGLAVFLLGLEVGIFPVGEALASDFAHKGSTFWILIFAFLIGFGTTIAEPALVVIAQKAAAISSGRIDATTLRLVVAFSVGFAIALGSWRIIRGFPIHYFIIAGYILVVTATAFSPKEIVGLAYDLGGVTTSTVTVPLVAALGIGLATTIKGRNPVLDGFGLIAFASLTPMIFVQFYGIVVYEMVEATQAMMPLAVEKAVASEAFVFTFQSVASGLFGVITDVTPIMAIIFFFQYVVLKKKIKDLKTVLIGFALVMLGLYAFILGLEMGLFSLGETMAYELTQGRTNFVIYGFAFAIGFSTTMAEPSLTAIARKASDISDNKINSFALRMFVALGVAIGIALGAYRIVSGGEIVGYITFGYLIVIGLTFIAPKYIIPIAYDSGGVTTSTVTVPLVAALGLGLATNIPGRDPLIDGFGLIAFASLFPMITVMLYGVITERLGVKGTHQKEDEHNAEIEEIRQVMEEEYKAEMAELRHAIEDANDMSLSTINVDATSQRHSYTMAFSSVHIIVPNDKKDDALLAAKDAGASGVTIMEAHGMGLAEMDNFYDRLEHEATDVNLMFIVQTHKVDAIVQNVMDKLDIVGDGHGISYSYPVTHLKGLSLKEEHL
ncbi:MAG: DUF1538 domain-containing protein [Campylobacterota bacterium]|nr:DUF1538 domain-containing protein [Campylobacterota bacterium]